MHMAEERWCAVNTLGKNRSASGCHLSPSCMLLVKSNVDLKDLPGSTGHNDCLGIGDRVSQVDSNISLCEQPKCRTFETISLGNYAVMSSFSGKTVEISGKIIF